MLRARDGLALDAYWVATGDVPDTRVEDFDGAVRQSVPQRKREHGIPLLGTCGGFQHALLE